MSRLTAKEQRAANFCYRSYHNCPRDVYSEEEITRLVNGTYLGATVVLGIAWRKFLRAIRLREGLYAFARKMRDLRLWIDKKIPKSED